MTSNDDDDFWTTYIATTPEEDKNFRGLGRLILWPIVVLLIALLIGAICHGIPG